MTPMQAYVRQWNVDRDDVRSCWNDGHSQGGAIQAEKQYTKDKMSTYTINVPDAKIEELKTKLSLATFPDEIEGAAWDYGAPLADIKRLSKAWQSFDWRSAEAKLNALPNYHRRIQVPGHEELDVHYIYQQSEAPNAVPLLFVHGWPGSYIEVTKLLPLLKEVRNGVSFHVIAPSLPNFGWSEGVRTKGFALREYAETCHQLMMSLGYSRYVTQGGDWGFYVTRTLGLLHPEACLASHVNMVRASPPTFLQHPILALQHAVSPYSRRDREGFERTKWFEVEGFGYNLQQRTKPQTLGYGLHDSPVALLAWIYEKLHDWTDDYPWTEEEILTWISIYYFSTAGPAASVRIYYEGMHTDPAKDITRERVQKWIPTVKLGLCYSPKELSVIPLSWGRTLGPVVFESQKTRGGHFAAWEQPEEIVSDLVKMFGESGPCHKIAAGSSRL